VARELMKIQVVSDLHLEFTGMSCELDCVAQAERDLLIVAGDTAEGTRGQEWLIRETKEWDQPVVQVMGNHEYYNHDIYFIDEYWVLTEETSLIETLQCRVFEYEGLRIAGCTLWTDPDAAEQSLLRRGMADFTLIQSRGNKFTPGMSASINQMHRKWLLDQKDIDIVVTHHAPTYQSITPYWQKHGGSLNPGFAGHSDDIIRQLKPKYWIHGHMHSFMRYWHDDKAGGTQILCNPRGYGGSYQETTGFMNGLIIEV